LITLYKFFYPQEKDIWSNVLPAYRMAELLGLTNYQWMSYDYIKKDWLQDERYKRCYRGQLNKDGEVNGKNPLASCFFQNRVLKILHCKGGLIMARITMQDIRLADYSLEKLGRLHSLRQKSVMAKPEICIERARLITGYYTANAVSFGESMQLNYARAVGHFLANKAPLFFDDNLLAGTTTSKPFGAPVYPEFTGMTIWPELDTISSREKNPLLLAESDKEELNLKIFPYWLERNILEYTRSRYSNPASMRLFERIVFFLAGKAGGVSHTVPCYQLVLEKGVGGILADAARHREEICGNSFLTEEDRQKILFYESVMIVLEGIKAYVLKLSKKALELAEQETDFGRRENYRKMSEVCAHVPLNPPRTFREAVNALWLAQIAVHAENVNMAISPGRLDQILYPYFAADMAKGSLSVQEALELVGCLWLKMNDNTNIVPAAGEELFGGAGTVPAVTVGGVDADGEDAVNDLTYIMLRVAELLKTRDPNLNARYHYEKNARAYCDRVTEVIANTKAIPAFHNDAAAIGTLQNQGVKIEDARDYAIIGCVELTAAGKSYDASSSIMLNLVSVLELALYNGRRPVTGDELVSFESGADFTCFAEFWDAFTRQLLWVIKQAVELNNLFGRTYQEILPSPLLSAFFTGPMEKGKDLSSGGAIYNASGATHIGFADTVDSLNAMETVLTEQKCTFKELLAALKNNFQGYEALQAYLIYKTPKYGTQDPVAVKNARNLIRLLYETYQGHINYRGGKYIPAYWSMTSHAGQGKLTGALPNGRKAYKAFASGLTPVSQAAGNLAECLTAVGGLDSRYIPGGAALNLKLPYLQDVADIRKFAAAVEAYFRQGGLHCQCNIMSYDTLLDAKHNPDRYPDLLVRVSGYSAYFNDLNEVMKDEIIARTQYDLSTGLATPFPDNGKRMLAFV
jgi:formate C-acetyltransferase